jgi:hypothetical protein
MPKKTTILAIVALMLFAAAPVSAQRDAEAGQEESDSRAIEVTGVIEKPEATTYMYGSHAVLDEASGKRYALRSDEEGLLDDSTGRRTTVSGTLVPGYENGAIEGGPPLIEVDRVQPAEDDATGGEDVNRDGVVNGADGEAAAAISDAARTESKKSGQTELPATGGPALSLGAFLLILVSALLTYRALR